MSANGSVRVDRGLVVVSVGSTSYRLTAAEAQLLVDDLTAASA